jgi:hypothetical protein
MEFVIESLNKNELNKVIDLYCLVWNQGRIKTDAKTNWAFFNNFSKVLVIKNQNEDIIAVRGGIKWPLVYNNRVINCYQFHGTCVHENYRRLGLFSKLNQLFLSMCEFEDIELIFNVSVKASRLGYEKLGWKYIKGLHRLTKFFPYNAFIKPKKNSQTNNDDIQISISEELLLSRNDQFKNLIHTNYTNEFLKWRIIDEEEGYRIFNLGNALVIYKMSYKNDRRELIIGEVFLKNGIFNEFSEVIAGLVAKEKPYLSYTYIFETHPYFNYYLRTLYLLNPFNYNLNFGTRIIDGRIRISDLSWGMAFLDIDTF